MSKSIPLKKKVLLVGWDSADWKIINELLADGEMNGVRTLLDGGTHGDLATIQPQVSPMQWTSIATGKMAHDHGVHGFTEVHPATGKVVPVSAATRQCKTVWEILGDYGFRTHLVSWAATRGERNLNGKMASNVFGPQKSTDLDVVSADLPLPLPGTYWPEDLSKSLNADRVSPQQIGEDILQSFLPAEHMINQTRDRSLNKLRQHLAESYSTHSAATHLMETDPGWDFMAVSFRAIDDICHHFMPYHPPRMDGTSKDDFEKYQHVVKATYIAHDQMLQSLIALAGSETTVVLVSDHSFHSDHLRPKFTPRVRGGNTVWHRDQGIFLAKGPGIKKAPEPISGAGLLDITPTILHLFDLPIGNDMNGRVISEAFEDTTPPKTIPTWENPDDPGQSRDHLSGEDCQTLLQQFIDLGYIHKVSSNPLKAIVETEHENKWNLARADLYCGNDRAALGLLSECFQTFPERTDYAEALAQTQLNLGLINEAQKTLDICMEIFGNTFSNNILRGKIESQKGNHQAALDHLELIHSLIPEHPQILEILCRCSVALKQWDTAQDSAIKLLVDNPNSHMAHLTLARCELHQEGNFRTAVKHARRAIKYHSEDPLGHLILGQAYAQLERFEDAIEALSNCLKLKPTHTWALAILQRCQEALAGQNGQACGDTRPVQHKVVDIAERQNTPKSAPHKKGAERTVALTVVSDPSDNNPLAASS